MFRASVSSFFGWGIEQGYQFSLNKVSTSDLTCVGDGKIGEKLGIYVTLKPSHMHGRGTNSVVLPAGQSLIRCMYINS